MARARPVTSLDLDQDAGAVRRAWRFERVGWVMIALAIAGGLAGAFGDGPLSSATVVSADGRVGVNFERVVRYKAPSTLEVRLAPDGTGDTTVLVSLDTAYLRAVEVMRVTPEPVRVRAWFDRVEYQLLRPDPTHSVMISFAIQAGAPGRHRVRLETTSGSMEFDQLVLP
ncbi:MAG: hypothetical protein LH467_08045 [Gemmatimonadaceae bacterium]|nr:hypothetical protein [Gemmatimonadaceae bacterium]